MELDGAMSTLGHTVAIDPLRCHFNVLKRETKNENAQPITSILVANLSLTVCNYFQIVSQLSQNVFNCLQLSPNCVYCL